MACELCDGPGGEVLWQDTLCRVVLVEMAGYPGFCRVILNRHVSEMSDLPDTERRRLMHVVFTAEDVLRRLMCPHKINLASLGNLVPHVHWHVIPRFTDDAHFPQPIWTVPLRAGVPHSAPDCEMLRTGLAAALAS